MDGRGGKKGHVEMLSLATSSCWAWSLHKDLMGPYTEIHTTVGYRHTEAMAGSEEQFSFLNLEFSEKDSSCGFPPPFFSWAEGGPGFLLHFSITLSPFLLLLSLGPHIYGNTLGILGFQVDNLEIGFFFSDPPISTWNLVWHIASS